MLDLHGSRDTTVPANVSLSGDGYYYTTTDEIFNGGYFLAHFDAADLFTTLGGTRDPAELRGTTVPGFWHQPGTDVDPELLFDWRQTPLPPAVQALSKLALEQAKRKKARR